jgi:glucose/arabinose dehydrogenase
MRERPRWRHLTGVGLALGASTACSGPTTSDAAGDASASVRFAFEELSPEATHEFVTDMKFFPNGHELLVAEKSGRLVHYDLVEDRLELQGEFQLEGVEDWQDCGLLSVAFDPGFESSRYVYVAYCIDGRSSSIVRITLDGAHASVPASAYEILTLGDPRATHPWHNVGSIGFDPEGRLWALFGDKTIRAHGQDAETALGSVLRFIPAGASHPDAPTDPEIRAVPAADNPFATGPGGNPLVWAHGLRSPWRGALDHRGHLWVGDVGADAYEEVDVVRTGGENFGWGDHEGPCTDGCSGLVDPVLAYDHEDDHVFVAEDDDAVNTGLRVVWAGPEYRPTPVDRYRGALTEQTLYGDLCVGFVRAARLDDAGRLQSDRHVFHQPGTVAWDQAADGYLYTATIPTCQTERPVPPDVRFFRLTLEPDS